MENLQLRRGTPACLPAQTLLWLPTAGANLLTTTASAALPGLALPLGPQHCSWSCPLVSAPATSVLSFSGKWVILLILQTFAGVGSSTLLVLRLLPLPQTQSSTFTLCTRPPKTQFKCHFLRETFPNSARRPITRFQPTGLVFSWYFAVCLDLRDCFINTCLVHKSVNSMKIKTESTRCTLHFSVKIETESTHCTLHFSVKWHIVSTQKY